MTNFKPILFSTPMVQAILEGRKTQTRRVVNMPRYHPSRPEKQLDKLYVRDFILYDGNDERIGELMSPYGKDGDVIWVREKFAPKQINEEPPGEKAHYFASDSFASEKWKPSIHMPKQACRIFLKIKSVRAERLQEISEEDSKQEGVFNYKNKSCNAFKDYTDDTIAYVLAKLSFTSLWKSINGSESWKSNPYVFVIEFERIEKPLDFIA